MKRIVFALIFVCIATTLFADLAEDIKQFGTVNGEKYLQPFVTAFGSDLNSGWFNTAKTRPFNIGVTINSMLAVVPDDDKTFIASNPNDSLYNFPNGVVTATALGNNGGIFTSKYPDQGIPDLQLPRGLNLKAIPLIVPQAHLGLPAGFEVAIRGIPPMEFSKYGKISFWGVGAKYQVSKLIPMLTTLLPISIQATYQQVDVAEILTVKSMFVNLQASRGLVVLPLTIYGGIGYEDTQLDAKYTYTEPWPDGQTQSIDFNIKGDNKFRFTFGARLKILLLDVMLDYSVGKYQTIRAGVGVSI
ncbi:MAG TPA: hypothetical protein ENK03_00150 [Candidatus Cloacimonetes bacterium]|nr:hypothetical protein [Candidatus Cloacimonadota bacterium]